MQTPSESVENQGGVDDRQPEASTDLQQAHAKLVDILSSINACIARFRMFANYDWEYEYFSAGCGAVFGYTAQEFLSDKMLWWSRILPEDRQTVILPTWSDLVAERTVTAQYRFRHKDGTLRWISSTLVSRYDSAANCWIVTATDTDISEYKQTELAMQQAMEREQQLREREQFISTISQNIRRSLNLEQILGTTVDDVRQFLQVDRVVIYRFNTDWSGLVIAESLDNETPSIANQNIYDPCFEASMGYAYQQGRIHTVNDIHTAQLSACYATLLTQLQVRAVLAIPILVRQTLWGLLIAHQCSGPRQWQQLSWNLLRQLSHQLAIGIQQAEVYQEAQQLNNVLEYQVQVRTNQLQQALNFEALLKRITDHVRDSLDESQILQTAVSELGQGLQVDCCNTGIYSADYTISTVTYEYAIATSRVQGQVVQIADIPHLYDQLLNSHYCQCCLSVSDLAHLNVQPCTVLACPIFDDQGTLGDLWLMRPPDQTFEEPEIRLVQQVANQCAIAIRQARLYETAQTQVRALEQLNSLKDSFLSTVSHELRTPMTSIKLAIEMLELNASQLKLSKTRTNRINQYIQILQTECQREISLIDDLLNLSRLESDAMPPVMSLLDLNTWLLTIIEPFIDQAQSQQQQLQLDLSEHLPLISTDAAYLERILNELLTNACKYTPANERIVVSTAVVNAATRPALQGAEQLLLVRVSNTGIEILEEERDRVFEKFYRIPNQDPWQYRGIGLGLALVKKLVDRLGAAIELESTTGQTTFTLVLPVAEQAISSP